MLPHSQQFAQAGCATSTKAFVRRRRGVLRPRRPFPEASADQSRPKRAARRRSNDKMSGGWLHGAEVFSPVGDCRSRRGQAHNDESPGILTSAFNRGGRTWTGTGSCDRRFAASGAAITRCLAARGAAVGINYMNRWALSARSSRCCCCRSSTIAVNAATSPGSGWGPSGGDGGPWVAPA